MAKPVPEPTLRRLPLYHRFLKTLQENARVSVSCTEIGSHLKLDPTQVRKDLEATGIVGRPKVGYVLGDLIEAIANFLGWDKVNEAFLVGAGHLGAALMGYPKFKECGLDIVAAFDIDPAKTAQTIRGKVVLPLEELPGLARRMHILLGIITVPADAAQAVADRMLEGGMQAIWNFAPVRLSVPDSIIVHNEDLYCSLAALSQKLAKSIRERATQGEISDVAH